MDSWTYVYRRFEKEIDGRGEREEGLMMWVWKTEALRVFKTIYFKFNFLEERDQSRD